MAFFHDAKPPRQPFLNAPAVLVALIGVLIGLHAARVFAPQPWPDLLIWRYAFIPARLTGEVLTPEGVLPGGALDQLLPFVSYIFLHGGWEHVIINSLWALAFGAPVARRLGPAWFLVFFILCGIAAALMHLAANWGSTVPVVGASGGVSGLMGAAIRIMYGERDLRLRAAAGEPITGPHPGGLPGQVLAPIFSRPVIGFSLVWLVANAVVAFTGLGLNGSLEGIAWEAHIGGYVAGLLLITPFDRILQRLNSDAMQR